MEALGLKARSNIQTYDGMRRFESVCLKRVPYVLDFRKSIAGPAETLLCACLQTPKA